jgi:Xaa-Pro aminopeptidase
MTAVRHLDHIRQAVRDTRADALWIHPAVELRYLTGLDLQSIERPLGLVIPADGGLRVAAPEMFAEQLAGLDADVVLWTDTDGPDAAIAAVLDGIGRLLIEPSLPAGHAFGLPRARPGLDLDLDPGIVAALRRRKEPDEIARLEEASRFADRAVEWLASRSLEGLTERQLAGEVQAWFLQAGAEPYPGIFAVGPNAALPHHETGDTPIDTAVPLLADFGCITGGYYSDITRVLFPPDPAAEVQEAHDLVLGAYDAAFAVVAPGVPCAEVDRAAREVFEQAGQGDRFLHRVGHGLGLEIHEDPYLTGANATPLEIGDVFSIEPGLYFPGRFGLRYENTVVLEESGPRSLNHAPRRPVFAAR